MIDPTTISMIRDIVTIFGVIAGLSYYIITVRNQTKTRHIQIMQGVISAMKSTPSFNFDFLDATWEDYDDFMEKYGPESGSDVWSNNIAWVDAFEYYGLYVREGLLDIRLISLSSGGTYTKYWEKYGPVWKEYRKRLNEPRWGIEAEYLYTRIKDYLEKHPELMQ